MKPWRSVIGACALLLWGACPGPASAAWCNVFQVCCNHCGHSSASYYAADPCNPCPQPVCTTRYVQRCYYQPVTSYQTRTYYEPVTTYRTSYYYEPVTSYRYSYYYDPCTCNYQQVACPTTCYRLRTQCCPVTSWVQRCCQVPVTSYYRCSYWEPVTTCCTPVAPPCSPAAVPQPSYNPPAVSEQRTPMTPGVQEYPSGGQNGGGNSIERYYHPPTDKPMPQASGGTSYRLVPPRLPIAPPPATPAQAPPQVKLENIVAVPAPDWQGKIVRKENGTAPR